MNLAPQEKTLLDYGPDRLNAIAIIAENRIQEAIDAGEFENLPGKGMPLPPLQRNPFVSPELQLAIDMLARANFVPEPFELRKKIASCQESAEEILLRLEEKQKKEMESFNAAWIALREAALLPVTTICPEVWESLPSETVLLKAFGIDENGPLSQATKKALAQSKQICEQWAATVERAEEMYEKRLREINRTVVKLNNELTGQHDGITQLQMTPMDIPKAMTRFRERYR